jgi:phosphate transport system substrate-binding protein
MPNAPMNKWIVSPIVFAMLIAGMLAGCDTERKEMPTKGHVTVAVAESVGPMIAMEKDTFEDIYPQAHVETMVMSSREAIARFFNDSITIIVSARALNSEEREVAKKANITIAEFRIAWDGVAVITNSANTVKGLRTTQLDSVLTGKITRWDKLGSILATPIELCMPNRNTGTYEFAVGKIHKSSDTLRSPTAVARSSAEMVKYVASHSSAIGLVGLNWLKGNEENIVALELADPNAPDSLGTRGKFFSPHQAYIYQKYYPLTRDIFIYSRADNYGVAAGFTTFITSAPGQKIVMNSGLVPATMPVRLVETTSKPVQ